MLTAVCLCKQSCLDQRAPVRCYSIGASQVATVVKNPPANPGDIRSTGSIPGLERSPAEGNGNPLQYFCLENPMDRRAWRSIVFRVARSQTWLKQQHTHYPMWRPSALSCYLNLNKWMKSKYNLNWTSSVAMGSFQVLKSHAELGAPIVEGTGGEQVCHLESSRSCSLTTELQNKKHLHWCPFGLLCISGVQFGAQHSVGAQ